MLGEGALTANISAHASAVGSDIARKCQLDFCFYGKHIRVASQG
jgi:hypothetical protein